MLIYSDFIKFEFGAVSYELLNFIVASILICCFAFWASYKIKRYDPKEKPSKLIVLLESIVDFVKTMTEGIHNKRAVKALIPMLATYMLILLVINTMGIFGLLPPASNINISLAFSLLSFILIQGFAIKYTGIKYYLKGFVSIEKGIFPLTVFDAFMQPITLALRLTINMLVGVVIIDITRHLILHVAIHNPLISYPIAILLSVPLSLFLDVFVGVIQAYVFTLLTTSFLAEKME